MLLKYNLNDEKIVLAVAQDIMSDRKGDRRVLELAKKFKDDNIEFILMKILSQLEELIIKWS